MFNEFKNIKARDETEREASVLEKIITLGEKIINDFELQKTVNFNPRDYIENKIGSLEVNYEEKDIVDLIRSEDLEDNTSKQAFGIYTGCLITKLTEKRHTENKKTTIVIDRVKQDYILYGTKKADSIIINNCEGEHIGKEIGYDGEVNQIIINNCKGRFIGEKIGFAGNIEQVIINNCKGNWLGYYIIANRGIVEQVIINNCKGENIGSCLISYEGTANQAIINNCEGQHIGGGIGFYDGNIGQIIINNCKGDNTGNCIGSNDGNIKQAIINNCKGKSINEHIGFACKAKQAIINDSDKIQKQGLTGLIELVDSLTGKDYQEVQEIARMIGEYV